MDAIVETRPHPVTPPLAMQKSLLRFITCGSVDDGKSTLIGRILHDTGGVFDDQMSSLENDSKKFGTQGERVDFALLVDGLAAEREQGITIDVAYRYFSTPRRSFIVADTPGHEQYTRNMATGASTAELAIILVDARKGVLPQTRRHSFIVSMLGVRSVVVAINKMDLVAWSRDVFERIVADYRAMAAGLGFEDIVFIPVSALEGDNIASASQAMDWYRGPTLLAYLETVEPVAARGDNHGFAFPVQWVNRPNLDFRGYCGWLTRGSVKVGDEIVALPGGRRSRIARIVTADGDLDEGVAGQALTLTLTDEIDISRGDVIVAADNDKKPRSRFSARILWMSSRPVADGSTYLLKIGTATVQAKVSLARAVDIHTFEEQPTRQLAMNEIGVAVLALDRPVVASAYRDDRELGGFILIDRWTNETMALGLVEAGDADDVQSGGNAAAIGPALRIAQALDAPLPVLRQTPRAVATRALLSNAPCALLSGAVVGVFLDSAAVGVTIGVIDLAVRVVLGFYAARAGVPTDAEGQPAEINIDGDGI